MSQWRSAAGEVPLFVHIAAGVFLGVVAAAFVIWRVEVWQAEVLAADAVAAVARTTAALKQERLQAAEALARQEVARRAQVATVQRAEEAARRHKQDEVERREAAWTVFYRKPAACDEARGGTWSVDCANEFMRAKQRFAELYDAGKL
jgi:hypothetical protein